MLHVLRVLIAWCLGVRVDLARAGRCGGGLRRQAASSNEANFQGTIQSTPYS